MEYIHLPARFVHGVIPDRVLFSVATLLAIAAFACVILRSNAPLLRSTPDFCYDELLRTLHR